jgi:hypothetical protein
MLYHEDKHYIRLMKKRSQIHNVAHRARIRHHNGKHALKAVAFILFAIIGLSLLQAGMAASYAIGSEAESGTLEGNTAKLIDIPGASGGQAVRFGQTVLPPAEVRAVAGGTSIAVVWRASLSPRVTGYEVYRDNQKVATVTPGSGTVSMEREGRRYIDENVARGTTYGYQVRTITDGGNSALSAKVSAKHPTTTTPAPSLTFEYIRAPAPANKALIEATVRKEMAIWYPKIGDTLAFPAYTPQSSLIIETNPDIAAAGNAGNRIGYNPDWTTTPDRLAWLLGNALPHEATHAITQGEGSFQKPIWFDEGIADWTTTTLILEEDLIIPWPPAVADKLAISASYATGASFLRYIEKKYDPNFPRAITIARHKGDVSPSIFTASTGKTEAQLIEEYQNSRIGTTGLMKGVGGKCIEVAGGSTVNGTKIQLATCNSDNKQKWTPLFAEGAAKTIQPGTEFSFINFKLGTSQCLDVASSGILNGTAVHYWHCNGTGAQIWKMGPNNSLVNPNSGKCLDTTGGGSSDGTQLVINECNGSASQRWALPQ